MTALLYTVISNIIFLVYKLMFPWSKIKNTYILKYVCGSISTNSVRFTLFLFLVHSNALEHITYKKTPLLYKMLLLSPNIPASNLTWVSEYRSKTWQMSAYFCCKRNWPAIFSTLDMASCKPVLKAIHPQVFLKNHSHINHTGLMLLSLWTLWTLQP